MRVIRVGGPAVELAPMPRRGRALRTATADERMLTPAEREWLDLGIEPAERDVWLDVGLGPHDGLLARACIDAHLHPQTLAMLVDGRSVAERLCSGATPAEVRVLLGRPASAGAAG